MNPFDAAIGLAACVALVMGVRSGFLRSLATIIGYLAATPIAALVASWITPALANQHDAPSMLQNGLVFFAVLLIGGIAMGSAMRTAIDDMIGPVRSIPDRVLGGTLGLVRVGLVALTLVVVFDRIIPPGHDPAFLSGSRIRPALSVAGQRGLKSLPPEVTDYIDRLKRTHGI